MSVVYVSPTGQDNNEGTAQFPYRTVSQSLRQSRPGDVVQLAPGTYSQDEQFPLMVPAGVTVVGSASRAVIIEGGGDYANAQVNTLNVAFVLGDRAQIRDTTITNLQGSGLLTTEGAALIVGNRVLNCKQHGIVVAGKAQPFISKNEFVSSGATGLWFGAQSKGEIRQNTISQSSEGLVIRDNAAPLVMNNRIEKSRHAVVVDNFARPVLRKNSAIASQETGLWVRDRAEPDIGHPQDLGQNRFEGKTHDVRNESAAPLSTAGNQINLTRVQGRVAYLASAVPDEAAVPPILLGNVAPTPLPPSASKANSDPLAGLNLDSRFNDLVGHWSAPFVEALADQNLIKGFFDGTFRPDTQVTRAQFAALAAAAFADAQATRPLVRFRDVPGDFWAAQAIRNVQTQGFISGFPDGSFRPNAPMTRTQAVVALVNGLGLGSGRSESLLVYVDRAQIPSYAIEPVAAATQRQIIVSYPDPSQLRPLVPITRAETTALVHQALAAAGKTPRLQSPFIPQVDAASPNFTDLSSRHWAKAFIDPLVQKGWLSGFRDGSFQPDSPMTRAQFAALLVGAFDPQPKRPAVSFRDVSDSFWGADVIQQAYRARFLSGFPDLTFDPNFPLTKLQALLALVSGLGLLSLALTAAERARALQFYADRADIPDYAVNAVAIATKLGLVFNRPVLSELRPNRAASRAEVSAMVYQALVLESKMPPVSSPDQVSVVSDSGLAFNKVQ